jgi:GNAT superfamily N-acetyltransferase
MAETLSFALLTETHIGEIARLGQQLNPQLALDEVHQYLREMFQFSTYRCFGLFLERRLIGISSAWISVRLYSGKQLEVDNVVIESTLQSKGFGKYFFNEIERWAKEQGCKSIELNTYLQNSKSHKFYFNMGFSILGFHFWKPI